jgi:hypothetical protein
MRNVVSTDVITPLIITYNEEPNIDRVLAQLTWARRIVVLDSGSTDLTCAICARYPNVVLVTRQFDSFANQCNYGLTKVESEWCLSIDADYIVPETTAHELQCAVAQSEIDGFEARLRYCIRGRMLRRAILPNRIVLFRTRLGTYDQDGHAHRLVLNGRVRMLNNPVLHDDRKPLLRWLASQNMYAEQEALKLSTLPVAMLGWPDRARRMRVIAPWLVPTYYLLVRGGILDGWAGLDYAAQRAIAELVLSIKLIERGAIHGDRAHAPKRADGTSS